MELQLCSSRSSDRPAPLDESITPGHGVSCSHLSGRLTGGRSPRALKGAQKGVGLLWLNAHPQKRAGTHLPPSPILGLQDSQAVYLLGSLVCSRTRPVSWH